MNNKFEEMPLISKLERERQEHINLILNSIKKGTGPRELDMAYSYEKVTYNVQDEDMFRAVRTLENLMQPWTKPQVRVVEKRMM